MNPEKSLNIGLLILRVGIGIKFIIHGWPKITGGTETWQGLGGAMANLGITFAPTFWGFMAALSEFGGGILLILGILHRPVAALLFFTMVVATVMHVQMDDPFRVYSHALGMAVVFLGLFFTGAGRYTLSEKLRKNR